MCFELSHDDFERICWRHYLLLESKFLTLDNYVMLDKKNYNVFSFEIMNQIHDVCSSIESVIKKFTKSDYNGKIIDQLNKLISIVPEIENETVKVINNQSIELKPFEDVKSLINHNVKIDKSKQNWWHYYNSTKHDKYTQIEKATLECLINSLAALFILNEYYLKKSTKHDTNSETYIDLPMIESRLFECTNLKWKVTSMSNVFISQ